MVRYYAFNYTTKEYLVVNWHKPEDSDKFYQKTRFIDHKFISIKKSIAQEHLSKSGFSGFEILEIY